MYTVAPQFTAWVAECEKIEQKHQLLRGPLPANPFSYRHGGEPQSPVYVSPRGYFVVDGYPCGRCGGAGGSLAWKNTGLTCYECGGHGFKGRTRDVPVYTAEQLDKLNAKTNAKAAKKAAEVHARETAFDALYADLLLAVAKLDNVPAFVDDVISKGRKYGTLSDAQVAAVQKTIERELAKKAQDAASGWVGTVGERITVDATVVFVTSYEGVFGTTHVHGLRDAAGNVLIHKGAKLLIDVIDGYPQHVKKGEPVRFSATVKEHGTRDGVKQTILARPSRAEFMG